MRILIINGPNLNLLGKREPGIYGNESFEEYFKKLQSSFSNLELRYFQSNVEGDIINELHASGCKGAEREVDHIIINPGGYSHTSVAIADAISAIDTPVLEVHISNIHSREEFRHTSITARSCKGIIAGFGLDSYAIALMAITRNLGG